MSINVNLFEEKVGYDWANKKMIVKVYEHLHYVMENDYTDKNWLTVIRRMLIEDGRINVVKVNGYYTTIRTILKDIGVIQYNSSKTFSKGKNWDRFYSDEDWSWFTTNTTSGGYGTIVK